MAVGSFMLWFIGPILAIVALALCPSASQKIRASNGRLEGEGLVKGARIVAWINLGISAVVVLIIVIVAIISAAVTDNEEEFRLSLSLWHSLR